MRPQISKTGFGYIVAGNSRYEHDIIFRMSGEIIKRKKKLSKVLYGTSHIISLEEAKFIYEKGARHLVIGSGQDGMVNLSPEANDYFKKKNCRVSLLPTPLAADHWNTSGEATVGLFHVTC